MLFFISAVLRPQLLRGCYQPLAAACAAILLFLIPATVPVCAATKNKPQQFPFTGVILTDRVNIRAGQSNNFEALAVVNKGEELVVTAKEFSWYRVALPNSAKIYMKADYAALVTPEIGEVKGDKVNIRARPNTSSSIVGQLLKGAQFFVQGKEGEWLCLRPVPAVHGWVHEEFLVFKSSRVADDASADPADAAARARALRDTAEKTRAARFAGLKPAVEADGQFEAEGLLVKPVSETGAMSANSAGRPVVAYQLKGGEKADRLMCLVEGPAAVLDNFLGARVVVRGTITDDPRREAVVIHTARVHLALP
jgi:uncharacterized protein YgiM (DUF1202 family)